MEIVGGEPTRMGVLEREVVDDVTKRRMEEMIKYRKDAVTSDPFYFKDSSGDRHSFGGGSYYNLDEPENMEKMTRYAQLALDDYNKKEGSSFMVAEIKEAFAKAVRGFMFYITFVAKRQGFPGHQIFQAKVWDGIWEEHVKLCRLKPASQWW